MQMKMVWYRENLIGDDGSGIFDCDVFLVWFQIWIVMMPMLRSIHASEIGDGIDNDCDSLIDDATIL